jgi:hypothetical protein
MDQSSHQPQQQPRILIPDYPLPSQSSSTTAACSSTAVDSARKDSLSAVVGDGHKSYSGARHDVDKDKEDGQAGLQFLDYGTGSSHSQGNTIRGKRDSMRGPDIGVSCLDRDGIPDPSITIRLITHGMFLASSSIRKGRQDDRRDPRPCSPSYRYRQNVSFVTIFNSPRSHSLLTLHPANPILQIAGPAFVYSAHGPPQYVASINTRPPT